MADLRRCIGSAKFGIEGHEAPPEDFPAQPSQKDGLGRMCKTHWKQYVTALRTAAVARKDEAPVSLVAVTLAQADKRVTARRTATVAERKAAAKLPETVAEVGTPEGQAALEAAAKEAQIARRGGHKANSLPSANSQDAG